MGRVVRLPVISLVILAIVLGLLIWVLVRLYKMYDSSIQQNIQNKIVTTVTESAGPTTSEAISVSAPVPEVATPAPVKRRRQSEQRATVGDQEQDQDEWGKPKAGGCKVCNYFYTK